MKITLLLITLGIGTTILTGLSYLKKGKKEGGLGVVAHACNPSTLGG